MINNAKLECLSTNIKVIKCSGLLCGRQRVLEILYSNKGCGCYSMQTRLSNLSISYSLIEKKNNATIFAVEEFSSLRISKIYYLPYSHQQAGSTRLDRLGLTIKLKIPEMMLSPKLTAMKVLPFLVGINAVI